MFKNGLSPTSSGKQTTFKTNVQAEGGGCTHCGNIKHTPDICFKIHGYPKWWNEFKARKQYEAITNEGLGRVTLVNVKPH